MNQPKQKSPQAYHHRILVMDDDPITHNIMDTLVNEPLVTVVFASTPVEAITLINTVQTPFSIIISEQQLSGSTMQGTDLLELAQKSSPHSLRFLVTGQMKLKTLLTAVNKGAIQRAIPKPIDTKEFKKAIGISLLRYERFLEKENFFALAKQQSSQLYFLNKELMEATQAHNDLLEKLSREIKSMDPPGSSSQGPPSLNPIQEMMETMDIAPQYKQQILNHIYSKTMAEAFSDVENLAHRNGLELAETLLPEGLHDPN